MLVDTAVAYAEDLARDWADDPGSWLLYPPMISALAWIFLAASVAFLRFESGLLAVFGGIVLGMIGLIAFGVALALSLMRRAPGLVRPRAAAVAAPPAAHH
jgi:predicted Na+-dependent transporter